MPGYYIPGILDMKISFPYGFEEISTHTGRADEGTENKCMPERKVKP